MSERPDLFVNKKSSLAEIIEVRIDATMPVFWTRGEHGSEHTRNHIEVAIGIGQLFCIPLLEGRLETLCNRSLTCLFQEIRCDIDMSPHSAELSFLRYATRRG